MYTGFGDLYWTRCGIIRVCVTNRAFTVLGNVWDYPRVFPLSKPMNIVDII